MLGAHLFVATSGVWVTETSGATVWRAIDCGSTRATAIGTGPIGARVKTDSTARTAGGRSRAGSAHATSVTSVG